MIFEDRRQAGRMLGERLLEHGLERPIVLGLPRGGVPVADEVAKALGAPLDVIIVRKLGVPFQPELGMGAIGEGGVRVLNSEIVRLAGVSESELRAVEVRERQAIEERAARYRGGKPPLALAGRTVVLVDDGIATGGTARAAVGVARAHGAERVVVAVPVGAPDSLRELGELADEVVALQSPVRLSAVGGWYRRFDQTSDDEVVRCLAAATAVDEEVLIRAGEAQLAGHLAVPARARGVVVFAHGSGSSRHSPRNQSVASTLNEARIGTLLFDLLTEDEAVDRRNVFDIDLLAERLQAATRWLQGRDPRQTLNVGYFGASTGAAAALVAAAAPASTVTAVVSRGGRPDLAMAHLAAVRAPTLLIVGSRDEEVLQLNEEAARHLGGPHQVAVVRGATHLFEEPGTLELAARLARDWFVEHLDHGARPATRRGGRGTKVP